MKLLFRRDSFSMIDKKIYRYTNVELLDFIKNSSNKLLVSEAKDEFEKRNLTEYEKKQVELEYLKYKAFQVKRKNEPLTQNEWLSFFILPFLTPKPKWREDHYSESELKRFKVYGFHKKFNQAVKARTFGYAFWLLTIVGIVLLFQILG